MKVSVSGRVMALQDQREYGRAAVEGRYYRDDHRRWYPSGLECPYCHNELEVVEAGRVSRCARMIRRLSKHDVIGVLQDVPETHTVLGCRTCVQGFTVPKR